MYLQDGVLIFEGVIGEDDYIFPITATRLKYLFEHLDLNEQ